jgi:predicted nuclease of predicted toxin-antitoxin system
MRLLADENVPRVVVDTLAAAGFDVAWVRVQAPGIADGSVLAWSLREERVLLTFDKDFGELVFRKGRQASCGVVLFRLPDMSPAQLGPFILSVLNTDHPWEGRFAVVEEDRVRIRELPG